MCLGDLFAVTPAVQRLPAAVAAGLRVAPRLREHLAADDARYRGVLDSVAVTLVLELAAIIALVAAGQRATGPNREPAELSHSEIVARSQHRLLSDSPRKMMMRIPLAPARGPFGACGHTIVSF